MFRVPHRGQRAWLRSGLLVSVFAATAFLAARSAHAAELRVVSAGAVQPAVRSLLDEFAVRRGHHAVVLYGPAGVTKARALGSDPADVAIVPPAVLRELSDAGAIARESRVDLWRVGIGAAVSKGAPKPKLETSAAFRQAVLDAPEIHHSDPALTSSAAYLVKLFERLGIAGAVRAKTKLYPRSEDALAALSHAAVGSIALAPVPEILTEPDVDLAAPLPEDIQNFTLYSVVVLARATHPDAAKALLRFLSLRDHLPQVRVLGFEGPQ